MKILREEKEVENSLNRADIVNINDWKRKRKILKETYDAQEEYSKLESEIKTKKLELKKTEMKAEKSGLLYELDNMIIKSDMANIQQYTDYVQAKNEQNKIKVKTYLKDGKSFARWSLACSIFSALTSCFGLYAERGMIDVMFMVACVVMLIVSVINNKVINKYVSTLTEFYNKDVMSKILIGGMTLVSCMVVAYSIYTNYLFWGSVQKSIVATVIYSCIFDVASVVMALLANTYGSLNFSKKYVEGMEEKVKSKSKSMNEEEEIKEVKDESKKVKTEGKKEEGEKVTNDCWERDCYISEKSKKEEMYSKIKELEKGKRVTPTTVGMKDNKQNFYNWINGCELVKKVEGKIIRA